MFGGLLRHAFRRFFHDHAVGRRLGHRDSGIGVSGGGVHIRLFRGLGGGAYRAFAAHHRRDHLFGLCHRGFVRLHDVELLPLGRVALGTAAGGAGNGVAFNIPLRKIAQLHAHQCADLILGKAGNKAVGNSIQNLGKAHQQRRGLDLVQHGIDHLHLVDAALHIAGLKGVALAGKGQRSLAVQMVPPLHKGGGVVVARAAY